MISVLIYLLAKSIHQEESILLIFNITNLDYYLDILSLSYHLIFQSTYTHLTISMNYYYPYKILK